ncbi:MAG: 16S rRNA (guanine(966)-N(2))-methyltransferase RsmD [Oscillospiraceae bacterium]|nr:16S rRNA (guanine(966)-N(2))-methyltransferase RsmD [Oscillospiraceae bacterium]MBQ8731324.1 16S rRNA (guanine(966)-N(2))-methyltransferase RsmD [Oscillospiraceae bacterium]
MRIITGSARGRRLEAPEGLDTRPTAEHVKEAVFSIIQFQVPECVFADIFAGSGQMGMEALSRGAEKAIFIENDKKAGDVIRRNLAAARFEDRGRLIPSDFRMAIPLLPEIDIAFLDPPYKQELLLPALELLVPKMSRRGIILCEASKWESLPETLPGFPLRKVYTYSKTTITAYRRADEE